MDGIKYGEIISFDETTGTGLITRIVHKERYRFKIDDVNEAQRDRVRVGEMCTFRNNGGAVDIHLE